MNLLQELTNETVADDVIPIMEAIRVVCSNLLIEGRSHRAGKYNPKGSSDFFNSNTKLVVGAAAMAISSHRAYQKNKRATFTFHAKDAYERRMITRIVDSMVKSKKFKIARTKFQGANKTWVMKPI